MAPSVPSADTGPGTVYDYFFQENYQKRFLKDFNGPEGRGPWAFGPGRSPFCLQICMALLAVFFLHPVACKIVLPKFPGLPSMDELAAENGWPISHMLVQTDDGYLLMMHRLGNNSGPPVLLMHGFLNAADLWLARGRKTDLVYFLLKEGYDIYLGNMRGNVFSRRHVKFKTDDIRFWDYSFHEVGYYDVPAMIDKILDLRKTDQLFYIGQSLGTTVFFVMASARAEYNAKIRAAVLVSPVAHAPDHNEFAVTIVRLAIANRQFIWRSLSNAGWLELLPRTANTIKAMYDFCDHNKPTQDYCLDLMGHYLGEHRSNLDRKRLAYWLSFSPAGSSLKTLYHLSQVFKTSEFNNLDLGEESNLKVYNSSRPPPYPLERITAPVALLWSYNDNLLSEKSVMRIKSRLGNVVLEKPNPDPKFNHGDFFLGFNAKETFYDDIIKCTQVHGEPTNVPGLNMETE